MTVRKFRHNVHTLHNTGDNFFLIVKRCSGAGNVTSIQERRVFAVQNGMQGISPIAESASRIRFQGYDNRKQLKIAQNRNNIEDIAVTYLQRVRKSLLDCETQNIDGCSLNLRSRRQCCGKYVVYISLHDGRADSVM